MTVGQNNIGLGKIVPDSFSTKDLRRSASVFGGVVLCMAAFGLWLDPKAVAGPETTIIRAGLTFLFVGIGFTLFNQGRDVQAEEIQLDLEAGVLSHATRGPDGIDRLQQSYDLADLRRVIVEGGQMVAISHDGEEVLRVDVAETIPQADLDRMIAPFQRTMLPTAQTA